MTYDPESFENTLQQFLEEYGDAFATPEDAFHYFMREFNMSEHHPGALSFEQSDPLLQSLNFSRKP